MVNKMWLGLSLYDLVLPNLVDQMWFRLDRDSDKQGDRSNKKEIDRINSLESVLFVQSSDKIE